MACSELKQRKLKRKTSRKPEETVQPPNEALADETDVNRNERSKEEDVEEGQEGGAEKGEFDKAEKEEVKETADDEVPLPVYPSKTKGYYFFKKLAGYYVVKTIMMFRFGYHSFRELFLIAPFVILPDLLYLYRLLF